MRLFFSFALLSLTYSMSESQPTQMQFGFQYGEALQRTSPCTSHHFQMQLHAPLVDE